VRRYHLTAWLCLLCAGLMSSEAGAQEDFNFPGKERKLDPVVPKFEEPAPTFIKSAQAGFAFLALPTDARSAALSGAGVGMTGSASGIFTNPATLAFFTGREAFFTHVSWIVETKNDAGGVALKIPGHGTVGVGFQTFDAGTFNRTAVDPNPASPGYRDLGTFKTSNYALSFAYGFKITDRFAVGGVAKLAHQDLGAGDVFVGGQKQTVNNRKNALGVDLGTYFNTGFRNTVMAMSVQNFSAELRYQQEQFELPRNIRLGILFDLVSLWGRTPAPHHLDLAVDVSNPIDFDERALLGLEYTFQRAGSPFGVSLRGGYKTNHDTEDFSGGGGIRFRTESGKGVKLDYAFKHFDRKFFDSVHVLTGAVDF